MMEQGHFPKRDFNVSGACTLKINAGACNIILLQSNRPDEVTVRASKPDLDKFAINQVYNEISVFQKRDPDHDTLDRRQGSCVIGGVVIRGDCNSVRIINNGRGVVINGSGLMQNFHGENAPALTIYVPANSNLAADLRGSFKLESQNVNLASVELDLTGSGQVTGLTACNLKVASAGSSLIEASVRGGDLDVNLLGSGDARICGDFFDVSVCINGAANITTQGLVTGDYAVSCAGAAVISHSGKVSGRTTQKSAGSCQVRFS